MRGYLKKLILQSRYFIYYTNWNTVQFLGVYRNGPCYTRTVRDILQRNGRKITINGHFPGIPSENSIGKSLGATTWLESHNGSNNQQRINNNRTTTLERTAAKANWGGGGLNAFNLYQIFALDSAVVEAYKMLTLKAPITTAAEDNFCNIFPNFRKK